LFFSLRNNILQALCNAIHPIKDMTLIDSLDHIGRCSTTEKIPIY